MADYLDFAEISKVPFQEVLNWQNVPFQETKAELKGDGFIVNKDKNLYFNPQGDDKGSVINWLSTRERISLREAAQLIRDHFNGKPPEKKEIPEYELHYHKFLEERGITPEIAQEYELGLVKSRGVMAGKIAIKIRDAEGEKVAYIGRNLKGERKYFFFKGYTHDHIYNLHRQEHPYVILTVSPFDVLHLVKEGFPFSIGLLQRSMSAKQEELMKRFKRVVLFHPEGDNIALRLSKVCFVKQVANSVQTLGREEIKALF